MYMHVCNVCKMDKRLNIPNIKLNYTLLLNITLYGTDT